MDMIQGFVQNRCPPWQVGSSCSNAHHSCLVILTAAKCISLSLSLNSTEYLGMGDLKLTPSIQQNVDSIRQLGVTVLFPFSVLISGVSSAVVLNPKNLR